MLLVVFTYYKCVSCYSRRGAELAKEKHNLVNIVMPAKAGIHAQSAYQTDKWILAFASMTKNTVCSFSASLREDIVFVVVGFYAASCMHNISITS